MKILERMDEASWWEVARACDYATFFHTPLWRRLAVETFRGCRDASIGAELDDGVRVVFPLIAHRSRLPWRAAEVSSTFGGCYGGPIADGPLDTDDRRRLFRAVVARAPGGLHLTGNPLHGPFGDIEGLGRRLDGTHRLELDAPFTTLSTRFSRGHRANIAKGRRLGVTTRIAESVSDYRGYYLVYKDSLTRWGAAATSRYPWRLFANGARLAGGHRDHIALWLAEFEGRIAAGAWMFYWNQHAVYWHGAARTDMRHTRASHVLLADVIEDACRRGLRWFDFNPSGGHAGVAEFKRRFGAMHTPVERWHRLGIRARGASRRPTARAAENVGASTRPPEPRYRPEP
ncbi:MAG TPA: GNAT family N-acetyltransferase [Longimicrobiales bacterium]